MGSQGFVLPDGTRSVSPLFGNFDFGLSPCKFSGILLFGQDGGETWKAPPIYSNIFYLDDFISSLCREAMCSLAWMLD